MERFSKFKEQGNKILHEVVGQLAQLGPDATIQRLHDLYYDSAIRPAHVSLQTNSILTKHPIRVLIVDDVEDTRERLRGLLRNIKDIVVVGEASDGDEAIEQFGILTPDVMTTCINMPRLDGISATREICRRHPNARVVICTVQDNAHYRDMAKSAGARAYIVKPPSIGEYEDAIRPAAK